MKNQLLSCFVVAVAAPFAQAATIITNLPYPVLEVPQQTTAVTSNVAGGFGLPAGTNYTLDSVTLQLRIFSNFTDISVSLFGGSSSAPSASPLFTFNNPSFTADGAPHPYTFTPTGAFTLNASSNYCIVLDAAGASGASVSWTVFDSGPSGIASFLGQTKDASFPPTTPLVHLAGGGPSSGLPQYLTFQVDATAQTQQSGVPEPGTITLLGAGIAALAFLRRKS